MSRRKKNLDVQETYALPAEALAVAEAALPDTTLSSYNEMYALSQDTANNWLRKECGRRLHEHTSKAVEKASANFAKSNQAAREFWGNVGFLAPIVAIIFLIAWAITGISGCEAAAAREREVVEQQIANARKSIIQRGFVSFDAPETNTPVGGEVKGATLSGVDVTTELWQRPNYYDVRYVSGVNITIALPSDAPNRKYYIAYQFLDGYGRATLSGALEAKKLGNFVTATAPGSKDTGETDIRYGAFSVTTEK